jgi:hypothetical protein
MDVNDAQVLQSLKALLPKHRMNDDGRIVDLSLEGRKVDDAAMNEIHQLTALRGLSLHGASVTDAGIAKIREMPLQRINLSGTLITDAGLDHIETLVDLRDIWLMDNQKLSKVRVDTLREKLRGVRIHR